MSGDAYVDEPVWRAPPAPDCGDCGTAPPPGAAFCARCGARLRPAGADVLSPMDEPPSGPAPDCPRCRRPVRAGDTPFPRREPGMISAIPWNGDWDGRCQRCGFVCELRTELDTRDTRPGPDHGTWGMRRTVVFRPKAEGHWAFLDLQHWLAGIEVEVTTQAGRQDPRTERLILTVGEVRRLLEALQGPLALLLDQHDWTYDTT